MNPGLFDNDGFIRGLDLRSWLAVELHTSAGPVTVAELVDRLHTQGLEVSGRASKVLSDTLRWEVRRGRIRRLARGVYTAGRLARSTLFRMRQRVTAALGRARRSSRVELAAVVAQTRNKPMWLRSLGAIAPVNHPGSEVDVGATPPTAVIFGRTIPITRPM